MERPTTSTDLTSNQDNGSPGLRRPFLVTGCGKLGQLILTQIKLRLIERHRMMPDHIKLLAIDSADAIAPVLEPNREFIRIHDTPLDDLWRNRAHHSALSRYFDTLTGSPLPFPSLVDGAEQKRLLTMIALLNHLDDRVAPVLRWILLALTDARHHDWLRSLGLLILGDGWGAHGSGLPLAMSAILSKVANDEGIRLDDAIRWGMFALPGGTPDATLMSDANTCALLRELAAVQEGGRLTLPLPGDRVAQLDRPPFDYVLLESVHGQDNSQLGSIDALIDMMVEGVLVIVDSTVGNDQRGVARDHRAYLQRRGVKGDLAVFSTQSVVVAEVPRAALLQFFEGTALAQAAERLVATASSSVGQDAPWTAALTTACDPMSATQSSSGRAFVPKLKAEILAKLDRVDDKDRLATSSKLAEEATASRLPAVVERAGERASVLWHAVIEAIDNTVLVALDRGELGVALALVERAQHDVDDATIAVPILDEESLTRAGEALRKAVKAGRLTRGRAKAIDDATVLLLDTLDARFQTRAEKEAAGKLEEERTTASRMVSKRLDQVRSLVAAVTLITTQAQTAAGEALQRVARQTAVESTADALLRYKVLSEVDLWRGYRESLFGSTSAGLSDDAWSTVLGGAERLSAWLEASQTGIRERLLAPLSPYFDVWRTRDIEETLQWLGEAVPITVLRRLEQLAVERLSYSEGLFVEGQRPHSVVTLGVPVAERSIFRNEIDHLVSTSDPDRIVLARLSLGVPASALRMWTRLEEAAAKAPGPYPLHNIPGFPAEAETTDARGDGAGSDNGRVKQRDEAQASRTS